MINLKDLKLGTPEMELYNKCYLICKSYIGSDNCKPKMIRDVINEGFKAALRSLWKKWKEFGTETTDVSEHARKFHLYLKALARGDT
jgi:hypothetical protein